MPRKTTEAIVSAYAITRDLRDKIRDARNQCMCERHEVVGDDFATGEPCWKSAREWTDECGWDGCPTGRRSFRFNPPIDEWCAKCRYRQAYTEQLRAAIRDHAAAKRAVLRRGRSLARMPLL